MYTKIQMLVNKVQVLVNVLHVKRGIDIVSYKVEKERGESA